MYLLIGKIITTHGVNGEIRIRSDFDLKNEVFKVGSNLYIGNNKEKMTILSYRVHKGYDMVKLSLINSLDKAISYKQKDVYINKDEITFSTFLESDYINSKAYYNNKYVGDVTDIIDYGSSNKVFVIIDKLNKKTLIPFNKHFILKFDNDNKIIHFKDLEGLL